MSVCRIIMALNPKCLLCFLPNQNLNNKFHLGRIVTISLGLNDMTASNKSYLVGMSETDSVSRVENR